MDLITVCAALVAFLTSGCLTAAAASQSPSTQTGNVKRLPPPVQLQHVKPDYPRDAEDAGVQGKVVLDARIGLDGTVTGPARSSE